MKASVAGGAEVPGPLELPTLRPLLDKHNLGTIDGVWLCSIKYKSLDHLQEPAVCGTQLERERERKRNLNIGTVYELLEVLEPDDLVVDVAANLHQPVETVGRKAVRTQASATVETAHVLLVLLRRRVRRAAHEETLFLQRLQPRRLPYRLQKRDIEREQKSKVKRERERKVKGEKTLVSLSRKEEPSGRRKKTKAKNPPW